MLIIVCFVTQNPNLQLNTKFFIIFKSCDVYSVNSLLNIKIFAVNGQIILEFTVLYSWNKCFISMQLSDIFATKIYILLVYLSFRKNSISQLRVILLLKRFLTYNPITKCTLSSSCISCRIILKQYFITTYIFIVFYFYFIEFVLLEILLKIINAISFLLKLTIIISSNYDTLIVFWIYIALYFLSLYRSLKHHIMADICSMIRLCYCICMTPNKLSSNYILFVNHPLLRCHNVLKNCCNFIFMRNLMSQVIMNFDCIHLYSKTVQNYCFKCLYVVSMSYFNIQLIFLNNEYLDVFIYYIILTLILLLTKSTKLIDVLYIFTSLFVFVFNTNSATYISVQNHVYTYVFDKNTSYNQTFYVFMLEIEIIYNNG